MHSNCRINIAIITIVFTLSVVDTSWGGSLVVDRFVAGVNDEIITLSEFLQALEQYRDSRKETGKIPPEAPGQVLRALVDQRLLLQEARRFQVDPIKDEDLRRILPQLEQQMEGLDQAARAEYLDQMRRQWMIKRFIERRIFVRVGFEEVKAYYRKHADVFAGKELLDVREAIEEVLREEQRNLKLRELLEGLRKKARIVIYYQVEQVRAEP